MDIFYICDVETEGTSYFHGDLYELRKNFYDAKGNKVSVSKKITDTGADGKLKASMSRRGFKWKKKLGRTVTEQSYRQSNSTVLVRRDFNGSIVCKIFYDEDLAWYRTEYYSTDSFVQAKLILRPASVGNIIERLSFVEDKKYYEQEDLVPVKLDIEDFENYYDIEHCVILSTPDGDFAYKPDANVYVEDTPVSKESDGNTVLIMNAWEIKGGSVPNAAKHPEPELSFKALEEIGDENEPETEESSSKSDEAETNEIQETETPKEDIETEAENQTISEKTESTPDESTENETAENEENTTPITEDNSTEAAESAEENVPSEDKEEFEIKTEAVIKESEEKAENAVTESAVKTLSISNGKFTYSGNYVDGKREGIGRTETLSGVTVYNGEYHEDKRNGVGASFFTDGKLSFAGNWSDDKKNGVGVSFRPSDGSVHIANWNNGSVSENITLVDGKGNLLYSGTMIDGKKNGVGISKNKNTGYTYIGEFADGKSNGTGSLFDENGKLIYNGSWSDGKKNGQGTEFDAAGNIVYSGEWLDNEYHNGILYQKIY